MTTNLSLTLEQRAELQRCERVIQSGLETFELVGNALISIRDSKLCRETHDTFEAYVRDKWGMSKMHAHRMMGAAKVVANLESNQLVTPATESQARPLTSLPAEQQVPAWKAAVEIAGGKQPTAKQVEEAVERLQEPADTEPKKPLPRYVPADGLKYAEMAILNLEKIQANDTQREAAFARVTKWITKHQ